MSIPSLQVAFITGRSMPGNLALSPEQQAFLERVTPPGALPVYANFPWESGQAGWQPTGLLRASLNNAREYLNARKPEFTRRYQPVAQALLESAEHTVLLAGSCGLALFNQLALPPPFLDRVSVFAWGPVAHQRPGCRHLLVQGSQDLISRLWLRDVDACIRSGHMGYLSHPELVPLCRNFIAPLICQE